MGHKGKSKHTQTQTPKPEDQLRKADAVRAVEVRQSYERMVSAFAVVGELHQRMLAASQAATQAKSEHEQALYKAAVSVGIEPDPSAPWVWRDDLGGFAPRK